MKNVQTSHVVVKEYKDFFSTALMHVIHVSVKSLLYEAVEYKNIEILQFLLKQTNIDVNQNSLFYVHESGGCIACSSSSYLTKKNPLILAVENNNVEIVKLLLEQKNVDINTVFEHDKTDDYRIHTKDLIENLKKISCENINWRVDKIMTPLEIAKTNQNQEIIDLINQFKPFSIPQKLTSSDEKIG